MQDSVLQVISYHSEIAGIVCCDGKHPNFLKVVLALVIMLSFYYYYIKVPRRNELRYVFKSKSNNQLSFPTPTLGC